jgi:hypothetical protein
VSVDPANLFLPAAVTTIPCFNTTYRFTKSQPKVCVFVLSLFSNL